MTRVTFSYYVVSVWKLTDLLSPFQWTATKCSFSVISLVRVHWQAGTKQKLSFAIPVASLLAEGQNNVPATLANWKQICLWGQVSQPGYFRLVCPLQIRGNCSSTTQKVKNKTVTQLKRRKMFKISSLFNLLQPVEVDGNIFQQAGLLNELQHSFLCTQALLFSVHLWGMFQDVVAPPLCNYLNHKENKQVSNSSVKPTRGSCDQQQSQDWRWRRFMHSPKKLAQVHLYLPGG